MEKRSFLHLQGKERGELVVPDAFQRKLLPYEWGLIQALEISEQEYREIFQRIAEEQRKRPAEYAHIPDVVNEPVSWTTVLVSLAIGLVSTGVAILLAPKPPKPDQPDDPTRIDGTNQQGRTRFNQSIGFDGAPQLARLGSRIPVVFGRDRIIDDPEAELESSGGIIVEPLLVWSQVISKGTYQNFKGQYVLADYGLDFRPDRQAFMMGGQPIDDIYEVNYELFWSSKNGSNILTGEDSIYGKAAPGDTEIFTVPGSVKGFCSAFSPTNKSVFGVHGPIRNGGRWSLNWRVISNIGVRNDEDDRDPGRRVQNARRKICGSRADSRTSGGMAGTGRWYSPQMGISGWRTSSSGSFQKPSEDTPGLTTKQAKLGWEFKFSITSRTFNFPEDLNAADEGGDADKKAVNYDDINSSLNSLRASADDAMQPGEIFCINQTLMQVISREGRFEPNLDGNQNKADGRVAIVLRVIGFVGPDRTVGISHPQVFTEQGVVLEPAARPDLGDPVPLGGSEANWYSLVKFDIAQVANTRPCECTEIGIKSQVWTRLNGLCNFADVPTPQTLIEYDTEDDIQVSNGSINKYTWRTSFFRLAVRVSDRDTYNNDLIEGYAIFEDVLFAIRGQSPTDQFNSLRIFPLGSEPRKYEYRLIPVTATYVYRHLPNKVVHVLDTTGPVFRATYRPNILSDAFDIEFKGRTYQLGIGVNGYDSILDLEELHVAYQGYPGQEITGTKYIYNDPSPSTWDVVNGITPKSHEYWWRQVVLESIFGNLNDPNNPDNKAVFGEVRTAVETFKLGSKNVKIFLEAVVEKHDGFHLERYKSMKTWKLRVAYFVDPDDRIQSSNRGTVVTLKDFKYSTTGTYYNNMSSKGKTNVPSTIDCTLSTGEPRKEEYRTTVPIEGDEEVFREWENYAQVKEVSCYDEITRSCDQGPEHEIMYVNESDGVHTDRIDDFNYNNMSMLGVKLKSMNQTQQLQAMQVWLKQGMDIKRLTIGGVGPTDLLGDIVYFLMTDKYRGMQDIIPADLIDRPSFEVTNRFLETNRLFFNGAIADRANLRGYIAQIAPAFLIHLSIKNGKFYMAPAVPHDSTGAISLNPVPIAAYFNDGNIVDGSFKLQYLNAADRRDFRCVVKFRQVKPNSIPQEETLQMQYNDLAFLPDQEDYDLTQFCTTFQHAQLAARYLLASRRRVDHTIEFSTSPFGIALAPGDYIKVDTISSPLETKISGRIGDDLQVIGNVEDGTHRATIYRQAADEVVTEDIVIADGRVTDESLRNSLFAIPLTQRRLGVYMVEELQLNEEGMVEVKASHHPVDEAGVSKINQDLTSRGDDDRFTLID